MKAFLDTSSLLKLYHQESDTEALSVALAEVEVMYLSELARLEFCSAIWKKVRTQEINSEIAAAIIDCFDEDYEKFFWIKAISKNECTQIAQDFCLFSRRKNRRIAGYVTVFTT